MTRLCPQCGTPEDPKAYVCPTCGAAYPEVAPEGDAGANPYSPPLEPRSGGIPLNASLPLGLGLAAILVVAFMIAPGIGLGLSLLAVPAYVRALSLSSQRVARGETLTVAQRVLGFLGSVGVVLVCAIAGGIAFFFTCLGGVSLAAGTGFNSEAAIFVAIAICAIGTLTSAGLVYWKYWPNLPRRRRGSDD